MTPFEIVAKALPGANPEMVERILWGRTPWPVKLVPPRELWKAADRFRRAAEHGIVLCDYCDNEARKDDWICSSCERSLHPSHPDDK